MDKNQTIPPLRRISCLFSKEYLGSAVMIAAADHVCVSTEVQCSLSLFWTLCSCSHAYGEGVVCAKLSSRHSSTSATASNTTQQPRMTQGGTTLHC
jgi:hypothetical protein